jgi:hypothetical protein
MQSRLIVNFGKPFLERAYCDRPTLTFLKLALNCDRLALLGGALAHRVHYIFRAKAHVLIVSHFLSD